jgi:hypothetical protein
MMILAAFATLCEAYSGIWPNVDLFRRLIYFKTETTDSIPIVCGAASFYAHKTTSFPGLKGKESCKKWQRSFFYVRNLKKDINYINLPPFDVSGPVERDSWGASLPRPGSDMAKILQRIVTLQTEGGLKLPDLLLAFLDARVSPLQRRPHKMCFLGSGRDPSHHSSKALMVVTVAQKANRIAEVKLPVPWAWGFRPYNRNNPVAEVCSLDLASASFILQHW